MTTEFACQECGKEMKPLRPSRAKWCSRTCSDREWRRRHPAQVAVNIFAVRVRRQLYRAYADSFLTSGCVDCGNKNLTVLDFDHVRGVKIKGVAVMVLGTSSFVKLEEEIAKCEVRCANCHRIVTAGRRLRP